MPHPFDPKTNQNYHPDDTPDLYLTDEQVRSYLSLLPKTTDQAEIEARSVIELVESEHRAALLGGVANPVGPQRIEAFRARFGHWPWATRSARSFYKLLGN